MGGLRESELCCVLIEEKFGSTVAQVAKALIREPSGLPSLMLQLRDKVKPILVKKALVVLEQFDIVKFKLDSSNRVFYSIDSEAITALLKIPRCGLVIKVLYGPLAESLFLQIAFSGRLSCSETLRRVAANAGGLGENLSQAEMKELFCRLAEAHFIGRCAPVESVHHGCPQFSTNYDQFSMLESVLSAIDIDGDSEPSSSRKRKAADEDRDADMHWRVNFARFDRYFRDELVAELVVPKNWTGDEKSSKICKQTLLALLKANETRTGVITASSSNPVSVFDVVRCAREKDMNIDRADVDWALRMLVEDGRGVIRKAGDSGGGLYIVDFECAIKLSCQNHIECLIREQLDSKAVRVFRLLQTKGHLEEEQIEKLTMMSSKETRELLFAMQEEGYVFTRPVGKTQDFAPARTFYLYYVDLTKTVRGVLEYTCKSLRNLVLRRREEVTEHKYLAEKHTKMAYIIDIIKEDDSKDQETKDGEIADVKDTYMPAADYAKYEKFVKARSLIDKAEIDVERVLLTLRLQMMFASRRP